MKLHNENKEMSNLTTVVNKLCQTGLVSLPERTADLIDRETENIRSLDSVKLSMLYHMPFS